MKVGMNARELMNDWLSKINPGDPGMVLNEHGQCRLESQADQHCMVYVPAAASTEFMMFQDIASLPRPCDASVYEEVLKLNLPSETKRDGALALDPETRQLVLIYTREIMHTDVRIFCAILENFLQAGGRVRRMLSPMLQAGGIASSAPARARSATLSRFFRD